MEMKNIEMCLDESKLIARRDIKPSFSISIEPGSRKIIDLEDVLKVRHTLCPVECTSLVRNGYPGIGRAAD